MHSSSAYFGPFPLTDFVAGGGFGLLPENFCLPTAPAPQNKQESKAPAMSKADKTLVTVATYNEMENLPKLVEEIFRHAPHVDLLVIDDNSPDGTGRWSKEQAAKDRRIQVLERAGKQGLGGAIIAGMQKGIEQGYRYVLNMDADFSHDPRYLPALIAGMEAPGREVDVMIGSRYVPGGKIEGWPFKRYVMSKSVNVYSRLFLGLTPRDCSGGYRCYRTSLLRKLDFDSVQSKGYSFQEEILFLLKQAGARFGETPITFVDRVRGTSKIDSGEAGAALKIILRLALGRLRGR